MKNSIFLYLMSSMFFLVSCANVEKMVETGNYDKALDVAVRKMAGKKAKKVKYVRAAEEAFDKVTQRDMDRISALRKRNGVQDWEKIYAISNTMIRRQENIRPLLPLLDKEGYHAGFNFVKAEVIREEARDVLSEAFYEMATESLLEGRRSNKLAARQAYDLFNRTLKYKSNFKDAKSLRVEAEQLGITNVLIKLENNSRAILPFRMEEELLSFYNAGRLSKWKRFHINPPAQVHMDYLSKVVVADLKVSPEYFKETIHHFHKQINETQYARDVNGRVLKDSLGNKIEILVPKDVRATVVEVEQSKKAVVDMVVEVFDQSGRNLLRRERMQAIGAFQNDACRIQGDRRAVEGRFLNLGEPLIFPTDESLILTAADELKEQVTDYLVGFPFDRT